VRPLAPLSWLLTGLLVVTAAGLAGCASIPDKAYHPVCLDKCGDPRVDCDHPAFKALVKHIPYMGVKDDGWRAQRIDDLRSLDTPRRPFDLAFLEYGEAGSPWAPFVHRQQVEAIKESLTGNRPIYLVVYVNGWHNNAHEDWSDPGNDLVQFEHLLARRVDEVERLGLTHRVLGVFVGWRGETWSLPLLNMLTIGDRSSAADAIAAAGDLRHDLQTLANALKSRLCDAASCQDRLLVLGHSLGGRILVKSFVGDLAGDAYPLGKHALIATLNPAVSASAFDRVFAQSNWRAPDGPPSWINLTSEDDWTTGISFRLAASVGRLLWFGNGVGGDGYSASAITALGHYEPYLTHRLTARSYEDPSEDQKNAPPDKCTFGAETCISMCATPVGCRVPNPFTRRDVSLHSHWFDLPAGAVMKRSLLWYNYADHCRGAFYSVRLSNPLLAKEYGPVTVPMGKIWNVAIDKSVLDGPGSGRFSIPKHNAFVQTNLGRMLDEIALADLVHTNVSIDTATCRRPKRDDDLRAR
jgi:hypothetical protein